MNDPLTEPSPVKQSVEQEAGKTLAQACCDAMFSKDQLAMAMGMVPGGMAPGRANVCMRVRKDMLNGFGSCHGGMIFSLADTAFAYACNSRNEANVAMDCRVDFLRPAFEGDQLTAEAVEIHNGRRSGLYNITVKNQDERVIAQFLGRSCFVDKPVLD